MKKIISVLTATRAEYGLLKPVINKLNKIEEFDYNIYEINLKKFFCKYGVLDDGHATEKVVNFIKEIMNDKKKYK